MRHFKVVKYFRQKMTTFKTQIGFSIELEGYQLKCRGEHKGFPLYETQGGTVTAVAVVNEPAIGIKAIENLANGRIYGPIMIPNLKIFRTTGPTGPENCYWYFSEETIRLLQLTFTGKIKIGH